MQLLLQEYIREVAILFNEMAIYLLIGCGVSGLLKIFVTDHFIIRYLGKNRFISPLLATLFGIPLPLCSCGVIPTGVSLYHRGASPGASVAFLTATPQTGMDSIFVTYGFLGLPLALFKVIAALVTGTISGIITNLYADTAAPPNETSNATPTQRTPLSKGLRYAFVELITTLRKWLLIGILLAAAISMGLPDNVTTFFQNNTSPLFLYGLILAFSVPLYVCATASVPIAATLILKGFPPGAAFVFLMAGPATNIATLTVLWKTLGKTNTVIYLLVIILGSFGFGLFFESLYPYYTATVVDHIHTHSTSTIKIIGSIALLGLILHSYWRQFQQKQRTTSQRPDLATLNLKIDGISCMGCVTKITTALERLPTVHGVRLDLKGNCTITTRPTTPGPPSVSDQIKAEITSLGYSSR